MHFSRIIAYPECNSGSREAVASTPGVEGEIWLHFLKDKLLLFKAQTDRKIPNNLFSKFNCNICFSSFRKPSGRQEVWQCKGAGRGKWVQNAMRALTCENEV